MKAKKVLTLVAFPALVAALVLFGILFREELWGAFSSPERLHAWIDSMGVAAPLGFVALQALQVIVFFIPGEIPQVAGGYLFGLCRGTLLSLAGITIGAAFNFSMARGLGVPFVYALFERDRVEKVRRLVDSRRARASFFLLFLIPGIPKDVLCYVGGLSAIRLPLFLLFSSLGRLPGIAGSALIGQAAADRRWLLAGTILAVALVLFLIGFLFRDWIQSFLERVSRRR
jgi:uncharacterized membrane protein YdjX (TVP38/TMEM64 family)